MPIRTPKRQKGPKIMSKSKVRIEENIEIQSCSARWRDPRTIFEPNPGPKKAHYGPKISKTTQKLGKSQKSEVKES